MYSPQTNIQDALPQTYANLETKSIDYIFSKNGEHLSKIAWITGLLDLILLIISSNMSTTYSSSEIKIHKYPYKSPPKYLFETLGLIKNDKLTKLGKDIEEFVNKNKESFKEYINFLRNLGKNTSLTVQIVLYNPNDYVNIENIDLPRTTPYNRVRICKILEILNKNKRENKCTAVSLDYILYSLKLEGSKKGNIISSCIKPIESLGVRVEEYSLHKYTMFTLLLLYLQKVKPSNYDSENLVESILRDILWIRKKVVDEVVKKINSINHSEINKYITLIENTINFLLNKVNNYIAREEGFRGINETEELPGLQYTNDY